MYIHHPTRLFPVHVQPVLAGQLRRAVPSDTAGVGASRFGPVTGDQRRERQPFNLPAGALHHSLPLSSDSRQGPPDGTPTERAFRIAANAGT